MRFTCCICGKPIRKAKYYLARTKEFEGKIDMRTKRWKNAKTEDVLEFAHKSCLTKKEKLKINYSI